MIYPTLLEQLCDLVAPLGLILYTSMRKANLFGYIGKSKHLYSYFFLAWQSEESRLKKAILIYFWLENSYFDWLWDKFNLRLR